MHKFLCDENIDKSLVKFLRDKEFDIIYIREIQRGMKDVDIIQKAYNEKRILITNDKDFGELVYKLGYKTSGLVLLRLDEENDYSDYIYEILDEYKEKIENNFVVINPNKIRIRKL